MKDDKVADGVLARAGRVGNEDEEGDEQDLEDS